jgi:photosystem II stability/assembly factor-like uncharacterized protein
MLMAVGERGHVLVSRDGGEQWQQSAVPVDVLLTGVCFSDDQTAYVVGHDETILTTHDAGAHWRVAHYAPDTRQPLLDVACLPDGTVIAVGAYATVARSDDHGVHFRVTELQAAPVPSVHKAARMDDDAELEQPHLNAIARADDGSVYVAGEAGHLYRSNDGGSHWLSLPSPYEGSWFSVLPLGGPSVLVAGLRGHLYRSDDRGEHWLLVPSGVDTMLDGATRLVDGRIVVVGLAGVVLTSADNGHQFDVTRMADRKGIAAVGSTSLRPVVVGESGVHPLTLSVRR